MKLEKLGEYKATLLMEELFEAFPEWLVPNPDLPGSYLSLLRVDWVDEPPRVRVWLEFPDATDVDQVDRVLDRHDKTQDDKNEKREKQRRVAKEKAREACGLTEEEAELLWG